VVLSYIFFEANELDRGTMRLRSRKFYDSVIGGCFILTVVGGVILLTRTAPAYTPATRSTTVVATPAQSKKAVGIPIKLKIPAMSIEANIDLMGLTADGDMEAPKVLSDTGWYKLGPRPGATGSAVIAGHYGDSRNKIDSAFDNLHTLKKGDEVSIVDDTGETIVFIVQMTRILGRDDDAKSVFISNDSKSHLNLVTCHGTWEQDEQTFSDRLVVFTDLKT
jgi:LPXTG-site transpeptidase (sortase) family protein